MKKTRIVPGLALAAALLLAETAAAQLALPELDGASSLSDPQHIAMLYHKFASTEPDFAGWARLTQAYKDAPDFDKLSAEARLVLDLQQVYALLTPDETITVEYEAELSDYSFTNKGYLVENFDEEMFIPSSHAGENFALIPGNALEYQWMPVEGVQAIKIDTLRLASKTGKTVTMRMELRPRFASSELTATMDGVLYHLMTVEIRNIVIETKEDGLVWESRKDAAITPEQSELMKLYR